MSARDISELTGRRFDLIIVGGGIAGCGIARDAALRGLSVLLVEKDDFAAATSSASSKLAHGGLRYLEYFRFGLVRESLHERETLLRIAPHLVRPLPFLLPVYRNAGRPLWKLRAGLFLYDLLAGGMGLGRHRLLKTEEIAAEEPQLQTSGLKGGFNFHDAQMNDARMVLENALDAQAHGALLLSRVECRDLLVREGRVVGVHLRDTLAEGSAEVEASVVVNAAGPWYARILGMQGLTERPTPRLSRGTHIIIPPVTQGHGILLQSRQDRRVLFALPWKGQSLVGTTEVEHSKEPEELTVPSEDIEYLLREVDSYFPAKGTGRRSVLSSFVGLRTLLPGDVALGEVSREARVREEAPGLVCVLGGKFTTYRAVAERAVDLVTLLIDAKTKAPCRTAELPLPGGDIPEMNDYFRVAEDLLVRETKLPLTTLRYLLGTYGSRHTSILKLIREHPEWAEPLEKDLPFTVAEVVHAVRHEHAFSVEDLIWRRTWRAHLGPLGEEAARRWEAALEEGLRGKPRRILV
jgi:glycerol-3-phosphate dehydrogenase